MGRPLDDLMWNDPLLVEEIKEYFLFKNCHDLNNTLYIKHYFR